MLLAQSLDLAQAKTDGTHRPHIPTHVTMQFVQMFGCVHSRFKRGIPLRMIDVGWPYFDAMFACIADDLCRRIKSHRLRIEEGGCEGVRIMAFQPCRGINKKRKARRMTFGKSVFAETFDLLKTTFGKF